MTTTEPMTTACVSSKHDRCRGRAMLATDRYVDCGCPCHAPGRVVVRAEQVEVGDVIEGRGRVTGWFIDGGGRFVVELRGRHVPLYRFDVLVVERPDLEEREEAPGCATCYQRTGNDDAPAMLWDVHAEDWTCRTVGLHPRTAS